jgi:hypothetical protein
MELGVRAAGQPDMITPEGFPPKPLRFFFKL